MLPLPVSGRGRRHNVDSPGHVSASDGARMPYVDSCCATEGAEGAEGSSSHCIGMLPFISACFVASDGVGIFV